MKDLEFYFLFSDLLSSSKFLDWKNLSTLEMVLFLILLVEDNPINSAKSIAV